MQLIESARLVMSIESRTVMAKSAETQQQVEEEIERSAAVFRAQKQLEAAEKVRIIFLIFSFSFYFFQVFYF
jgi:hypothetical protein